MSNPSRILNRVVVILVVILVLYVIGWRWIGSRFIIFNRVFPTEERMVDSAGKATFRQIIPAHPQKSMDEIADSWAVWADSMNWINLSIRYGDRTYAFGLFGHVFVLKGAGIDSSAVESKSIWQGDPHDYPFPQNPPKD